MYVQALSLSFDSMCMCMQSYSSCWAPPVAWPSLKLIVAENSPSGLTENDIVDVRDGLEKVEPSQTRHIHVQCLSHKPFIYFIFLSCYVKETYYQVIRVVLVLQFFSIYRIADRCPSVP